MASFSAKSKDLEPVYAQFTGDLFALCFFYTLRSNEATSLMQTILSDMAYREKTFRLALQGREGFFRAAYGGCMDYFLRKARKMPNAEELRKANVPFPLTDSLLSLLQLPYGSKAPLFFVLRLGLTEEEAGKLLDRSPAAVRHGLDKALKRAGLGREEAEAALASLSVGDSALQRVWDRFEMERSEDGFEGKQRLRFFKRRMDLAAPWAALGVLVFCGFCYLGVHYGWFNGIPYLSSSSYRSQMEPDPSNDPLKEINDYLNPSSQTSSLPEDPSAELPLEISTVSVFVPTDTGFTEYRVKDTPGDLTEVAAQMVALGGMPEGGKLLSVKLDNHGEEHAEGSSVVYTMGGTLTLNLEFNRDTADYLAEPAHETMLRAMVGTFVAFYQDHSLDEISFQCEGEEILCGSARAQDFLPDKLPVEKTVETNYRPAV